MQDLARSKTAGTRLYRLSHFPGHSSYNLVCILSVNTKACRIPVSCSIIVKYINGHAIILADHLTKMMGIYQQLERVC